MSSTPAEDYYSLLGVARDATADEIKRCFRKLARTCHPDVVGDSPEAVARFTRIREAYETLSDPERRHAYDNPPRRFSGGQFYRKRWRPPGGHQFDGLHNGNPGRQGRSARDSVRQRFNDPGNQMDLEDIFSTGSPPRPPPRQRRAGGMSPDQRVRSVGEGLREMMNGQMAGGGDGAASRHSRTHSQRAAPSGDDVTLSVDVPHDVAARGGTISVSYPRLKRGERGNTLFRYSEIHELRIPAETRHGSRLRVPRMGSAGAHGGAYGDLICNIQVNRRAAASQPTAATGAGEGDQVVSISVVEALLGGRIEVGTPGGRVRVSVPPGTSSDTRLRLRGRGPGGGDLFVRLRIVVPRQLDAESRELIERFAALNPDSPRR